MTRAIIILCSMILSASVSAAELLPLDPTVAEKISFRGDVWPIVKRHCWGCHSGADPKGGLNMDTVADMLKGAKLVRCLKSASRTKVCWSK